MKTASLAEENQYVPQIMLLNHGEPYGKQDWKDATINYILENFRGEEGKKQKWK